MSNYLLAIDGAGNLIYGQQGNRTPIPPVVDARWNAQRRRTDRQGGLLASAVEAVFPVIPTNRQEVNRTAATIWRPPSNPAPQIRRYYQSFDVSDPLSGAAPVQQYVKGVIIPQPSRVPYRIDRYYRTFIDVINPPQTAIPDRYKLTPFATPGPSVANQVRRYYYPQIIDGDQPVDHAHLTPPTGPSTFVPYRLARYYQTIPAADILNMPGDLIVTFSGATTTTRFAQTGGTSVTLGTA